MALRASLFGWKCDGYDCSDVFYTFQHQFATMEFDQLFGNGQRRLLLHGQCGLALCLAVSTAFLVASWLLSLPLPKQA
jgi:hypothetical protein